MNYITKEEPTLGAPQPAQPSHRSQRDDMQPSVKRKPIGFWNAKEPTNKDKRAYQVKKSARKDRVRGAEWTVGYPAPADDDPPTRKDVVVADTQMQQDDDMSDMSDMSSIFRLPTKYWNETNTRGTNKRTAAAEIPSPATDNPPTRTDVVVENRLMQDVNDDDADTILRMQPAYMQTLRADKWTPDNPSPAALTHDDMDVKAQRKGVNKIGVKSTLRKPSFGLDEQTLDCDNDDAESIPRMLSTESPVWSLYGTKSIPRMPSTGSSDSQESPVSSYGTKSIPRTQSTGNSDSQKSPGSLVVSDSSHEFDDISLRTGEGDIPAEFVVSIDKLFESTLNVDDPEPDPEAQLGNSKPIKPKRKAKPVNSSFIRRRKKQAVAVSVLILVVMIIGIAVGTTYYARNSSSSTSLEEPSPTDSTSTQEPPTIIPSLPGTTVDLPVTTQQPSTVSSTPDSSPTPPPSTRPTTASTTVAPTTASTTVAPTTASTTIVPTSSPTPPPSTRPTTVSTTVAPTTASTTVAPTTASTTAVPASSPTPPPSTRPTTVSTTVAPTTASTTVVPTMPPSADVCFGATIIADIPFEDSGSTVGGDIIQADSQALECSVVNEGAQGTWYSIQGNAGSDSCITVTTEGSKFNTVLGVYSGSCDNLTCVDDNNNIGFFNKSSKVTWTAQQGLVYHIFLGGDGDSTGPFIMSLTSEEGGPCN